MKKRLWFLIVGWLLAVPAAAQFLGPPQTITVVDSGTACVTAPAACATFAVNISSSLAFDISGTWTGTLTFEGTANDGVWRTIQMTKTSDGTTATTTTGNGTFGIANTGLISVRVRATAAITGSALVTATRGYAMGLGGAAGVTNSGTLTANAVILGNGTTSIKALGSLGTTTTLLHGNAAGAPTFGAVSLTADVTGNLPVTNLNSGTSASSSTFWRGDGTWATAGGSAQTNYDFTAGSRIHEASNGVLSLQDSTHTTFGSLLFGDVTTWPKLTGAANSLKISKQDNTGAAIGWAATRPGTCNAGDFFIDGGTAIASVCAASTVYEPFGVTTIPTAIVAGTSPAVSPANNNTLTSGTSAFRIDVGTGGTATQITFNLSTAPVGWNCQATNLTAMAAHVANTRVVQLSGSATAIVLESQTISTGAAVAFAASDVVAVSCLAF